MKRWQLYVVCLLPLLVVMCSCNLFKKKELPKGKPIARVKDHYLYLADIKNLVKNAHSPKDSAELVKNFVEAWLRKQLILDKAQTYLSDEQQDIEQQLIDYKESLLIYRYENELTKQKLDTVVKDEEVQQYYDQNKVNFDLREDIVKFYYAKLPKDAPKLDSARILIRSQRDIDVKRFSAYCYQYAREFSTKDTIWFDVNKVYRQIPIKQDALESLARNKMSGEVEDSSYIYLLKVNNFRGKTELAPLDYVKDDIRKIIINKRKIALINKTYDNLYKDGIKNGDLEKY